VTTNPTDRCWPDKFPWGAVLAAVIVWAVDSFALGPRGPWELLTERMSDDYPMERDVVNDRLELARVASETGDKPLVAVMGSSRAHAGMSPFEIRGALDELMPLKPALVMILLSEFDTNRPLRLVPQTAPGSFGALRELGASLGFPFVWEHRTTFLQAGLASVLNSYRYREVFSVAGLKDLRLFFQPGKRFRDGVTRTPNLLEGDPARELALSEAAELDKLARLYPRLSLPARKDLLAQCRSITRGAHADAQTELIAHAVAVVRAGGGRVLIVEGPLAPAADELYEVSIRQDFLDLTHLGGAGARQMSVAVGRRVAQILAEADE
jgi:hypothetical protein